MRTQFGLAIALFLAMITRDAYSQQFNAQSFDSPAVMGKPGRAMGNNVPAFVGTLRADALATSLGGISKFANTRYSDASLLTRGVRDASLYKKVSPSVVLIITKDGDQIGIGSGTLISNSGEIITNWHVVKGFSDVAVAFKPTVEGKEPTAADIVRGHVERIDETADLALVKVSAVPAGREVIKLGSQNDISVGLDVFAIGHPEGDEWTYTKGIISQYRLGYEWTYNDKSQHKADVIQTQTPINPGNSGGPLLSTSGTIIGINSFKSGGEGLNFAVALDEIAAFLSRSKGSAPPQPQFAAAQCELKLLTQGRTEDNTGKYAGYDSDCDGKVDAVFTTPDDKSKPITLIMDRNGDGKPDVWVLDYGQDGKWDLSFWDTKFAGAIDMVGLHSDGGIKPTSFMSYTEYKARYEKP